jgi:hypothetical protein
MKNLTLIAFFLSCILFFYAGVAIATPVQWSVNGNFYELILAPEGEIAPSWSEASSAAASYTYAGVSGHLATITSVGENNFLFSLAPDPPIPDSWTEAKWAGAWLGGKDSEGWLVGPEAGDAFSYVNWNDSEPNNNGYVYMRIDDTGKWYDDSDVLAGQGVPHSLQDPVIGYFVEYEYDPVPIPGAIWLLGSGLIGLIGLGKKLKK